jgi:hypothetical protein
VLALTFAAPVVPTAPEEEDDDEEYQSFAGSSPTGWMR